MSSPVSHADQATPAFEFMADSVTGPSLRSSSRLGCDVCDSLWQGYDKWLAEDPAVLTQHRTRVRAEL
eukprot:2953464-Prymnesium_polylepis.1